MGANVLVLELDEAGAGRCWDERSVPIKDGMANERFTGSFGLPASRVEKGAVTGMTLPMWFQSFSAAANDPLEVQWGPESIRTRTQDGAYQEQGRAQSSS
eukprot:g62842.t1